MILGVSMIGACEAFALAEKLGLARQKLFDVVSTSSGHCWSVSTYCPVPGVGPNRPADNDYRPGFAAALMLKDLPLARRPRTPSAPRRRWARRGRALCRMVEDGEGDRDFSGILRWLEKNSRDG